MAIRVGKSVIKIFGENLSPMYILAGLSLLLVIGPLLHWYTVAMLNPKFKIKKRNYLELIPFVIFLLNLPFIPKEWYLVNSSLLYIFFLGILLTVYAHFALYIYNCWRTLRGTQKNFEGKILTKSQQTIFIWLKNIIIGFSLIWVSYVLNIGFEEIPYITGPILYSIVIYYLSFKAFEMQILGLDGSSFKSNSDDRLFDSVKQLILKNRLFLDQDLSLGKISEILGESTHAISATINHHAQRNFNDFVNYYRVQDAKLRLADDLHGKYKIAAIAKESGFRSLSTFNSAFKKFEGKTPSIFRKEKLELEK